MAFGEDTPRHVIRALVALLKRGDPRQAPAASEALRVIGNADVLDELVTEAADSQNSNWILATLGRLDPGRVRYRLRGQSLLATLEPMLLMAPGANWLSDEEAVTDMAFLLKQQLLSA